jgi:hypothetical protein
VSTQAGTSAATTSSQAAAATLAAVREYKQVLDQHTPYLDVVATAAVREAAEGPAIAAAISGVLQRPLRILSGGLGVSLRQYQTRRCGSQQVGHHNAHLAAAITAKGLLLIHFGF